MKKGSQVLSLLEDSTRTDEVPETGGLRFTSLPRATAARKTTAVALHFKGPQPSHREVVTLLLQHPGTTRTRKTTQTQKVRGETGRTAGGGGSGKEESSAMSWSHRHTVPEKPIERGAHEQRGDIMAK